MTFRDIRVRKEWKKLWQRIRHIEMFLEEQFNYVNIADENKRTKENPQPVTAAGRNDLLNFAKREYERSEVFDNAVRDGRQ